MTEQHPALLAEIETLRDEIVTEEAMEAVERELEERARRKTGET